MTLLPSTRPGRWAAAFLGAFALLLTLFYVLVAAGQRGGETFFSNPWLSITGLGAAASGIGAGIAAAWAVFAARDRSLVVFVALFFGLVVTLFVAGELLFPH